MSGIGIFAILGRYSPAAREELLGWIEDELARDEQRLGRPLDYDDMQRSYSRAVRKYRRRPTFPWAGVVSETAAAGQMRIRANHG